MWFVVRFLPPAAALFAIVGGIVSMTGWLTGNRRLLDWDLDGITIKFNAAFCVTAVGIGLLLSALSPRQKYAIRAFGFIAAVIAGMTLVQHLTGIDFGIDTLLFSEAPAAAATSSPGRMGMPAASMLTSLGSALVLATYAGGRRAAAMLAIIALLVASLSLTGYLFGASQLYSIPRFTGIALQTATMIAIVSFGLISLIREHGLVATLLRRDAGGAMFRGLLLPVILIALTLGFIRIFVQNAGYVDTAFGTAARTLAEIVLLIGLLWWTAESLSRSEARSRDASKAMAENETHRRIAAAQEAERRRIARDLHDHIGQQLTGLRLQLDALCKTIRSNSSFAPDLASISEQTKKLDADLSLLVWQMRPSVLDSHGLTSALKSFVQEWSVNHGIEAEFQATASGKRLPPEIETNLYRIIQEALNNILKHANANKVSITMNYVDEEAVVVIEDDGSGFDPEADSIHTTESSGFGLVGMRERAVLVGGKLEIESAPGEGTVIMVRVPRLMSAKSASASNGRSA